MGDCLGGIRHRFWASASRVLPIDEMFAEILQGSRTFDTFLKAMLGLPVHGSDFMKGHL